MDNSSVSSSSTPFFGFDKKRFINNFYTKIYGISGEKGLHNILMALYRSKPECFIFDGDIHNSADGKDTYLSGKIYTSNIHYYNIHIYGIMRGWVFNVLRSEVYMSFDDEDKPYITHFQRSTISHMPSKVSIW